MPLAPDTLYTALCRRSEVGVVLREDGISRARWLEEEVVHLLSFVEFKFQAGLAHPGRSLYPDGQAEQASRDRGHQIQMWDGGCCPCRRDIPPDGRGDFKCAPCQRNKSPV